MKNEEFNIPPSPEAEMISAAIAAIAALRSYQHGNSSPDLAAKVADKLESAIAWFLTDRGFALSELNAEFRKMTGKQ